jgi:5-methylcytosine-specific restriction endonuclease McrA
VGRKEVVVKPRRTKHYNYRIDNHAWRVLSRKFKAYSRSRNAPCWLHEYGMCLYEGAPIDYAATPGTRMAYETDHKIPRAVDKDMMYEWNNLRASHVACNRSRQAKEVVPQGVWVRPSW